jgi:catechol 2,3-dioxygenase-like lactoylglutathione lyase family enzyme
MIRRLDHIGVLVRDSETALSWFRDVLGLQVALDVDGSRGFLP